MSTNDKKFAFAETDLGETPRIVEIESNDVACYWTFEPKNFSPPNDILKIEPHVFFNSGNRDPYKMSVNSKELSNIYCEEGFPEGIHVLGEGVALKRTEERQKEHLYRGFAEAPVVQVRAMSYDDHALEVCHAPVEGNYAHCNIELLFPNEKPDKTLRMDLCDDLRECFCSNTEHIKQKD